MLVCAFCAIAEQIAGETPLFLASQEGRVGVVRALVGAGASVDQSTVRYRGLDPFGWSERVVPLPILFCKHGLLSVVGASGLWS